MVITCTSKGVTKLRILIVIFIAFVINKSSEENPNNVTTPIKQEIVCIGTNGRMSVPSNRARHYQDLKTRYENCTYVDGNLELTWIQDKEISLSFLQHIREVTGYVLISHVDIKRIVLPSLQVIRGRTRFKLNVHDDEFAMMVMLSRMDNLELPALRDVLAGNVGIFNNYNLCHVKTINWEDIISGIDAKYVYVYNYTQPERECPPCHPSCKAGCWGEGNQNCQKFSKINCSPQCHEGRCYGPEPRQCCHLSCAGGCTGPKKSDCLACKKFYDDGECKDECPSFVIYNPGSYLSERNPNGKYAYGTTCVKTCPDHLLRDASAGACVRQCPSDKKPVDGECVACNGPCQKKCEGPVSNNRIIHAGNIESFRNCTIIEGSIAITEESFNGFQEIHPNFRLGDKHAPMQPSKLEVFSTLKEVTGYIKVQATHPGFTSLSYFRNLEQIGGRDKTDFFSSLYILKTSLRALHLRSLKKIRSGAVTILENSELCFAHTINWGKIMFGKAEELISHNCPEEKCRRTGKVCSSQCSTDGCWGAEPSDCLSCAKFRLGDQCLPHCNASIGIYEDSPRICKQCHEQCEKTCHGPGPGKCTKCKTVRDGPFCVEACPPMKYNASGECLSCHDNCLDGCTGPANTIGFLGCSSCEQALVDKRNGIESIEKCIGNNDTCPTGYYYEFISLKEQGPLKPLVGKTACKKCHPRCKKCTAYGFHMDVCQECTNYKRGEQCENDCPSDFFADDDLRECLPCAEECRNCVGPGPEKCVACRNYRIYPYNEGGNDVNNTFICTNSCPVEFPYRNITADAEPFCARNSTAEIDIEVKDDGDDDQSPAFVVGVVICAVILALFSTVVGFLYLRNKMFSKQLLTLTEYKEFKNGIPHTGGENNGEEIEEALLQPYDKRYELRKASIKIDVKEILGKGAFGVAFKGRLINHECVDDVAIKTTGERSTATSVKMLLSEIKIMIHVGKHLNVVSIIGACTADAYSGKVLLVVELCENGCLETYLKKHFNTTLEVSGTQSSDNSLLPPDMMEQLIKWSYQIASGMEHIASKKITHADLATRNVLLTADFVAKITDFGLSRHIYEYKNYVKMDNNDPLPWRWMALESLKFLKFSTNSDVWAYGVTLWEMFTLGTNPYPGMNWTTDFVSKLEEGMRLHKPSHADLTIFETMSTCWLSNPADRPNFTQLKTFFKDLLHKNVSQVYITMDENNTDNVTENILNQPL